MTRARWIGIGLGLCLLILAILPAPGRTAEIPRIIVQTTDTVITAGQPCWLNIYLSNIFDSIAAYQFLVRLDRPDLFQFDTLAMFDTVGTLSSGFEAVVASDTSSTGSMLLVSAIADLPFQPRITPPILPQNSGLLIRLPMLAAASPDTLAGLTCTVEFVGPVRFVDPSAQTIGLVVDTIVDTLYYKCDEWLADSCVKWTQVSGSGGYDTLVVDSSLYGWMDPTVVFVLPGELWIEPLPQLPCDFTADAHYAISDLTCFVSFLFGEFSSAACPGLWCDCDASGNSPTEPNVGDLTCLVAFLFSGGPPPAGL